MVNNIKKFGWFWGAIHAMMKMKPSMMIAKALEQCEFWECTMDECHFPFQLEKAVRQHFTQAYAASTIEGWEVKSSRLIQRWSQQVEEMAEMDESEERAT
jgi:hypothetical protein